MGDRGCKAIAAALEPRRNPDGDLVYNANLRGLDIGCELLHNAIAFIPFRSSSLFLLCDDVFTTCLLRMMTGLAIMKPRSPFHFADSHIGEEGISALASSLKPRYSNQRSFNTALCSLNLMCK